MAKNSWLYYLLAITMINIIWFILIFLGIIYSLITNNITLINDVILSSGNDALNLIMVMLPILVLWMGLLNIASHSGLLEKFAKLLNPLLSKLFPKLNKKDKALEYISSNVAANMLGLGSAATPFGLKAMQELQKNNPHKDTATSEMITFLVLNTSGVTIIPTTVIAMRLSNGSINPECIIITSILATLCSTTFGLLLDYFIRRRNE